jgi:hypothetical protein
MSRFSNFLLCEEYDSKTRVQKIGTEEALDLLDNCVKSVKNDRFPIYRGKRNTGNFNFVDPQKFTRVSANTQNYYTLLFSNLPSWKNYPKRQKSLICTTNEATANGYGYVYYVFPYDEAKIGVCPKTDLWNSFPGFIDDMGGIPFLNSVIGTIKEYYKMDSLNSYEQLVSLFEKADRVNKTTWKDIFNTAWTENFITLFREMGYMEERTRLINCIDKYFDPKKSGFKIMKPGNSYPKDKEVWTDSKCILMRRNNKDVWAINEKYGTDYPQSTEGDPDWDEI